MANPRFTDTHIFRAEQFSLGTDALTGRHYLSTPVSGHMHAAEYEDYFSLTEAEYQAFAASPSSASDFVEDCRMGRHQARLLTANPAS